MSDEELIKYKDSDDYIKQILLIPKIDKMIDYYTNQELYKCYRLATNILYIFIADDFPLKSQLLEDTDTIQDYFYNLKGQPMNKQDIIKRGQNEYTIEYLLKEYIKNILITLKYLGVLLKTRVVTNDLHKDLSQQNFGDDLSLYNKYKSELSHLKCNQLLEYMSVNMIYDVYALWRYDNAL